MKLTIWTFLAIVVLVFFSCRKEKVEKLFYPVDTHQQYRETITHLHLTGKALGKQWLAAADSVFKEIIPVALPFSEERFFEAIVPAAVAVEFTIPRGLKIRVAVEADFAAYFLDVFRVDRKDDKPEYIQVASKPQSEAVLEFTPNVQGRYLVRIQPELLEEGRMLINITAHASLAWPVKGSSEKDIISYFGVGRDGGERVHHGLDIIAPRGREAVAVSPSIGRPGTTVRGGNVIRINDNELKIMLYYAHLDTQLIERNTPLMPGDTVGTVGNTGNARTTIPHLHFGIYDGSWWTPVDPWYFLIEPNNEQKPSRSPDFSSGNWMRVKETTVLLKHPAAATGLRKSPATRDFTGNPLDKELINSFNVYEEKQKEIVLEAGTLVKILGDRGDYLFIEDPEGHKGYMAATGTVVLQPQIKVKAHTVLLFSSEGIQRKKVARLTAGTEMAELGHYRGMYLIRNENRIYWATEEAG